MSQWSWLVDAKRGQRQEKMAPYYAGAQAISSVGEAFRNAYERKKEEERYAADQKIREGYFDLAGRNTALGEKNAASREEQEAFEIQKMIAALGETPSVEGLSPQMADALLKMAPVARRDRTYREMAPIVEATGKYDVPVLRQGAEGTPMETPFGGEMMIPRFVPNEDRDPRLAALAGEVTRQRGIETADREMAERAAREKAEADAYAPILKAMLERYKMGADQENALERIRVAEEERRKTWGARPRPQTEGDKLREMIAIMGEKGASKEQILASLMAKMGYRPGSAKDPEMAMFEKMFYIITGGRAEWGKMTEADIDDAAVEAERAAEILKRRMRTGTVVEPKKDDPPPPPPPAPVAPASPGAAAPAPAEGGKWSDRILAGLAGGGAPAPAVAPQGAPISDEEADAIINRLLGGQ